MSTDACAFSAARPADAVLEDSAINPSWIVSGAPVTRVTTLAEPTRGTGLATGVWECTAGTFRWEYGRDEVVHIVEGEIRLTDQAGRVSVLRAGDCATFRKGDVAHWVVPEFVRKNWVVSYSAAPVYRRALGKLRRIAAREWTRAAVPVRVAVVGGPVAVTVTAAAALV